MKNYRLTMKGQRQEHINNRNVRKNPAERRTYQWKIPRRECHDDPLRGTNGAT